MLGVAIEDWLNTTSFKLLLDKVCNFSTLQSSSIFNAGNMNTVPGKISRNTPVTEKAHPPEFGL